VTPSRFTGDAARADHTEPTRRLKMPIAHLAVISVRITSEFSRRRRRPAVRVRHHPTVRLAFAMVDAKGQAVVDLNAAETLSFKAIIRFFSSSPASAIWRFP
jgi:hypothetical protein